MTEPVGQSPKTPWAADDDGDHSAFTHRDDDEDPPYAATVRPPGDEAGLRAALTEAVNLTIGPGNGTTTRSRTIEEWQRLYHLFDEARAALAAEPDREEPGLDVERLARAMVAMFGDVSGISAATWRARADLIADEYARLATPTPSLDAAWAEAEAALEAAEAGAIKSLHVDSAGWHVIVLDLFATPEAGAMYDFIGPTPAAALHALAARLANPEAGS